VKRSFLFAGISFFLLFLALTIGCGKKIKTETLGPDEFFEYAKKEFDNGKYLKAITDFTIIVLKFSGDPVVDDAQYYLAESHFKQDEFLIAVSEYQKLINDYPESQYVPLAQFKKGMSYYNLSSRAELDQEYTLKSIKEFQNFLEEYPDHELEKNAEKYIKELRIKLAKKKVIAATTYRKMGIFDSAVIYYDIILEEYYDTPQAIEALYYKGECQFKQKKYSDARVTLSAFIEKYPNHRFVQKAKERVEEITEILSSAEDL
jgi:outer membrane protein assembly factor BamD